MPRAASERHAAAHDSGRDGPAAVEAIESRLLQTNSPFALEAVTVSAPGAHEDYPVRCYKNGPRTLNELYRRARSYRDRTLVIHKGKAISYETVLARAARLSRFLTTDSAVQRGDRVAIGLEDGPDWIAAFIAITSIGATAVLVPSPASLAARSRQVDTTLALTRNRRRSRRIWLGRVGRRGFVPENSFDASAAEPAAEAVLAGIDADNAAVIAFTSGTTGQPKAVVHTHRGILSGLQNMMVAAALANAASGQRGKSSARGAYAPGTLLLSPLSHVSGYGQLLLAMMIAGKLIFPERRDAGTILKEMGQSKPTSLVGATPATLRRLLRSRKAKQMLHSLTSLGINGIALHASLADEIAGKLPGVSIATSYGQTETNGAICAIAGDELRARPRSSGRIVPAVDYKVAAADGAECRAGQIGEIWLRGAMTMRGYWGRPPLSADDGWLRTGDVGYVTADRHLHVIDRHQGCARIGSAEVSLLEVERTAMTLPDIAEAVCSSEGNPRLAIAVVPQRNWTFDPEMLAGRLTAEFGLAARDFRCVEVRHIPRNRAGKIDHRKLAALLVTSPHRARSSGAAKGGRAPGLPTKEQLVAILQDVQSRTQVPGIGVAVAVGGKQIAVGLGTAARDLGVKLTKASRFEMSCLMKFFASLVALNRADRGELDLDSSLAVVLPELGERKIAIRHLLSHTSGYRGLDITDGQVRWNMSWQRFTAFFGRTAQSFEPGSTFNYEHSEHVILGELLKRLTGMPVRQLVKEILFDPLGITPGRGAEDKAERMPYVANHARTSADGPFRPVAIPPFGPFWDSSLPDRTITLSDIVRVASSIDHGMLERLRLPAVELPSCISSGDQAEAMPRTFGIGCARYADGTLGHNGSMFGQTVGLRIDPETGICAAAGVNAWSPHARDTVLRSVLAVAAGRPPVNATAQANGHTFCFGNLADGFAVDDLLGIYEGSYLGEVTVTRRDGYLVFEVGPAGPRRRSFQIGPIGSERCSVRSSSPVSLMFFRDGRTDVPNLMLGVHSYRHVRSPIPNSY